MRFSALIIAVLTAACFAPLTVRAEKVPRFEDYKVTPVKFTEAKSVDLNSHPKAKMMRTRLREAFKKPADFAQKYVVMQHGCGTQCMVSWVINKETGKVFEPIDHSWGFRYRKESSLIIVDPDPSPCAKDDEGFCESYKNHKVKVRYYVLENDKLTLLNPEVK